MDSKKPILGNAAAKVGKNAAVLLDKAKKAVVDAVDQNSDGKLGIDDFSIIKDSVKSSVKESSENWNARQEQVRREKELRELCPVFAEDVEEPGFSLPKLLRIAEIDAKHANSEVCANSIGYVFKDKNMIILTIYQDKIDLLGLRFYPDMDCGLYYVDPNDRDFYISLDDYFNYLKIARVGELQVIAQALGATHFRVLYKEQKKTFSLKDGKATAGAGLKVHGKKSDGETDDQATKGSKTEKYEVGLSAEHHRGVNDFSKTEIAAEMVCIGHEPAKPELKYFRKDPQIQSLIALRMSDNTMKHQKFLLDMSKSSGIKEKDAAKIDAALKAMKIEGNVTLSSETQNEALRFFEYEIEF